MSFPPERKKIIFGSYGKMMRSAKWVASAICDPPNPRLITFCSGKSAASDFHIRIVEAPLKSSAPLGGGLMRSCCSYAEISFSQRAKPMGRVAGADAGAGWAKDAAGKRARIVTAMSRRIVRIDGL